VTTSTVTVAGCDCGKDSIYVCLLSELPSDLKRFARTYVPKVFRATKEDIDELLKLEVDLFVIEPTGSYSYIWRNLFEVNNKPYRLVSSRRVRHFCEYQGLTNKADRADAAGIAAYGLKNYSNTDAFLRADRSEIRRLYLKVRSIANQKPVFRNQLGQILIYQAPEMVSAHEGTQRAWLAPEAPALWRYIAKEPLEDLTGRRIFTRWNNTLKNGVGSGLATDSAYIASILCKLERVEYQLERELQDEIEKPEYKPYLKIFDLFELSPLIQAGLLARIFPFEDFLENGKPFREYIRGEKTERASGMTKRDRSEGAFKLSLGMGEQQIESGKMSRRKPGGSKESRKLVWFYVKTKIVMSRSVKGHRPFKEKIDSLVIAHGKTNLDHWLNQTLIEAVATLTETTQEIAALRLQYEFMSQEVKGNRRIMAVGSRFCRRLYKLLLQEFKTP
jgi:hypothetical protein